MVIDLTPEEIEFIKTAIWVGRHECMLPDVHESEVMDRLMGKLGADEWILIIGENYSSLIEQYMCSECKDVVSGGPPKRCPSCGSFNKYRGRAVTGRIEEEK